MDDLFSDLRDEDLGETKPMGDTKPMSDALPETRPLSIDDDEFDQLRRKTVRSESTFSGMDTSLDEEFAAERSSSFSFNDFSTSQKLTLLALVMLDIVAIGFGVLVVLGRI